MIQQGPKKVLSVFALAMINVIAVDSLRSLPIGAEYGFSIVFFYIVGALLFFIPTALVAAELATGWPRTGGIYVWIREAFGRQGAFITIWLQWIYNVVWYPTILSFLATTIIYIINPHLASNKTFMLMVILVLFWLITALNCLGMKISGYISIVGAIVGTIFPMLFIIFLGGLWLLKGHPSQVAFSSSTFWPNLSHMGNLAFFVAVLFGLVGMEMSAVHAEEVKNPQRDYPRALLYSTLIIFFSLVLASLAIAIVVPHDQISLVSGLIQAYHIFFNTYNMPWMTGVIAVLIVVGGASGVSAWIIGPTKGLMIAAKDDCIPHFLSRVNKRYVPTRILLLQGLIFTLLSTVFLLMPTVNSSYWLLSAMTAQLAMLVYVFMFAAVIKLRYSHPDKPRAFKIPGSNAMVWCVGLIGIATCIGAIFRVFST